MDELAPTLDARTLRRAFGLFASGVTVVCATDQESSEIRGMTANAFMSGSLHPPLVLVSVRGEAHMHSVIRRCGAYGVSVLPEGLEREARRFAGMPVADHEPGPRFLHLEDIPVLAGALCSFAARVIATHETGDHTLFIGQVVGLDTSGADQPPLGFHRSRFASIAPHGGDAPLAIDPWFGSSTAWG